MGYILFFHCLKTDADLLKKDFIRWKRIVLGHKECSDFNAFAFFMIYKKEFRNLLFHRIRNTNPISWGVLYFLFKPMDTLFIYTPSNSIGGGLFIQHGFSTIITCQKIGENFSVCQQVTIGYKGESTPMIGKDVTIGCGAKVLGGICVGDGSIIGANAVVVHDVNNYAIVGGIPAKIIGYNNN